jgi:hypothetical protein
VRQSKIKPGFRENLAAGVSIRQPSLLLTAYVSTPFLRPQNGSLNANKSALEERCRN